MVKEQKIVFGHLSFENVFRGTGSADTAETYVTPASPFNPFIENNTIDVSKQLAIIYAPNGVGKTSLVRVLGKEGGSYATASNEIFYCIKDQNSRDNIHVGSDDILGDHLAKEMTLRKKLQTQIKEINDKFGPILKDHGITAKKSPLITMITGEEFNKYILDLANNQNKGKDYDVEKDKESLTELLKEANGFSTEALTINEQKMKFFIENYENIKKFFLSDASNPPSDSITTSLQKANRSERAVSGLEEFGAMDDCFVCDQAINYDILLAKKKEHNEAIKKAIEGNWAEWLAWQNETLNKNDPFGLKNLLTQMNNGGDIATYFDSLKQGFEEYKVLFNSNLEKEFKGLVDGCRINKDLDDYQALIGKKYRPETEDIKFLQQMCVDYLDRKLEFVARGDSFNYDIKLGGKEVTGKDRKELQLSTGEQNFLSLAFELLKAKAIACKEGSYIVIDDPISSYDSIYKIKVTYLICHYLRDCKTIIFTHTLDLPKAVEAQHSGIFSLAIFNNRQNSYNGFIPINKEEIGYVLEVDKFIGFLANPPSKIAQEYYLWSLVPFMRDYAKICRKDDIYNQLCKVMHTNSNEEVELTAIYHDLFGHQFDKPMVASSSSIPAIIASSPFTILPACYPLLNKTLVHNFSYLYLRLFVEKELLAYAETKNIELSDKKLQLGELIEQVFPRDTKDEEKQEARRFLMSKKSLLNQFAHFGGNFDIFQPALDISDSLLSQEREAILKGRTHWVTSSNSLDA